MAFSAPLFSVVSLLALASLVHAFADPSCNVREDPLSKTTLLRAGIGAFGYDDSKPNGPSNWGLINCPGYYKCGTGKYQSPINVKSIRTWTPNCRLNLEIYKKGNALFEYRYAPNDFSFRCMDTAFNSICGRITYRGKRYKMLQMHVHSPSEHELDGNRYPMEIHFVHQARNRRLAVLGVMIVVGAPNPDIQSLIDAAMYRKPQRVNLARMLRYVRRRPRPCTWYGSLTTPPCTEGIQWIMSRTPLTASREQILAFRIMFGNKPNNRPIQPSVGRSIRCFDHSPRNKLLPLCNREDY